MRRHVTTVLLLSLMLACPVWAGSGGLVGALYVTTTPPGATIYVNGSVRGVSPCGVPDVGIGQVEVRAVRQGYAPATSTVDVKGKQTLHVQLELQELVRVGSLAVIVDPPGARIALDRISAGRTPHVILNVPAGTHRLEISAEGYRPFTASVTVAPNELHVVRKDLVPTDAPPSRESAAPETPLGGKLDWSRVPYPEELPEERVFQPVRELVSERHYEEALARLDAMPKAQKAEYAQRLARERSVIQRLRGVVDAAREVLPGKVGQKDYRLSLGTGFPLTCDILGVEGAEIKVMTRAGKRTIDFADLSAENVVRLAAEKLNPRDPAHRVSFALLYAAEGQYEEAYEQLRLAADKGADIATAAGYVDGERLWAAARRKDALRRTSVHTGQGQPEGRMTAPGQPVRIILDTGRGAEPAFAGQLGESPLFELQPMQEPFDPEGVAAGDVLMIVDPGPGRGVQAYGRHEVQQVMDAIHGGMGLVFFGALRAPDHPQPFNPLLRWLGALVRPERLALSEEAPEAYPEEYALAYPVSRHPVTAGARYVVFPMESPSLQPGGRIAALLRASRHLGSQQAGEAAPVMAAAGTYGEGRYVVFADLPVMNTSPHEGSPLYANAGARVTRNAILWVAGDRSE